MSTNRLFESPRSGGIVPKQSETDCINYLYDFKKKSF